jgi:hypothetical protein
MGAVGENGKKVMLALDFSRPRFIMPHNLFGTAGRDLQPRR